MITADVTGTVDLVTGAVDYNVVFQGVEFFLGAILGAITALVVWTTLKSISK